MVTQIYAIKSHMGQAFISGKRTPVTVFKVPSHTLIKTRTPKKDGYSAAVVKIGKKWLREVRLSSADKLIKKIDLKKILKPNTLIQVSATAKGKGFTGVIKRWGFSAQPRTHGQKHTRRAPGSIGRGTTPGRVLPGKKMPGRAGGQTQTIKNLKIVEFDSQNQTLTVSGPTPGSRNNLSKITLI